MLGTLLDQMGQECWPGQGRGYVRGVVAWEKLEYLNRCRPIKRIVGKFHLKNGRFRAGKQTGAHDDLFVP